METQKTSKKHFKLIIAVALLIAPLFIQGLWIYISGMENLTTQAEKAEFYYSYFPNFLRGNYPLLFIAFFSSAASLVLSALSLNKIGRLNWLAYLVIVISFLAGLLSLFQMM